MSKRLRSLISHWLFSSLQRQLAFSFGSVALFMMLGLTGLLLKQQQAFLDEASIRRASALAQGLAHSSGSWVLANDLVGLNEVVQGYIDTPNLENAFILSTRGEVLASTQAHDIGLFANDTISQALLNQPAQLQVLIADAYLVDIAAPIMINDRHIGWVRVELNQDNTRANLQAVLATSFQFTLMTTLIVFAVSFWLARRLGNRLQHLVRVARHIADGERNVRAEPSRDDEIGRLADNINYMLDTLTDSERDLDRLNHVYAAWTECIAAIVRETDEATLLNRICQILAERISLRLVFMGFTVNNEDWIRITASSDWELPYLKTLRISTCADRPESRGPLGLAIRQGQPQIFNDFLAAPDAMPWHAAARAESIRAVAAFPLLRGGKVVGGISVYSQVVDYFNHDIITLLNGLAADVSFALDNFDHEQHRRQTETELRLAASVFENSQEGIMITDANNTVVRVNTVFTQLTGYCAEEVVGHKPHLLASGQHDEAFYQRLWESINTRGFWQGEIVNRRKNGEIFPEWLSITRVTNMEGQVTHYVGTFVDITDRKINEDRIHKLAFYDPLTQLPNRRLLVDRLRQALVNGQRHQRYGGVMFMDLDRFKTLNDTQGHDLGDQLLIEASKRILECVREQDTVARLGGDEFVIMLVELSEDAEHASVIAHRVGAKVLAALNQPYTLHHFDQNDARMPIVHHSSASIGITLFQGAQSNCEELLKQADVAMYQAKQAGRNQLCAFNPDMQASLNQRVSMEADLRDALHEQQFCLHYQIQVDDRGNAVGAEVLLRWEHPLHGRVSPAHFIPLAEETGLIDPLGLWVLDESCKTLASWARRPETRHLTLAVNVSAKQFNQSHFVGQIKTLLQRSGIDPRRLKLEITESIILENVTHTIETLHTLRELGLSFSMDDFGTGYSSLSYLQRLPLSQLKIDQSFVRDLIADSNDAAITRTILALGKSLNIDVVAEGVETEEQRAYLLANGCRYFQGYLFGKPEPLAEFEQRLVDTAKQAPGTNGFGEQS